MTAYVIDTGIRVSHQDFEDRAVSGIDVVDDDTDAADCNGHGTHVAGTLGGEDHGIAKDVSLVGVRVLDCAGEGTTADVIAGLDWVDGASSAGRAGSGQRVARGRLLQAVNDAVSASVADGITYAVAAGNETGRRRLHPLARVHACRAHRGRDHGADARAPYSNVGTCLDLFAPGSSITSAWYDADTATNTINGTSMATPHVTGAAALYLAAAPTLTPAEVSSCAARQRRPPASSPNPARAPEPAAVHRGRAATHPGLHRLDSRRPKGSSRQGRHHDRRRRPAPRSVTHNRSSSPRTGSRAV